MEFKKTILYMISTTIVFLILIHFLAIFEMQGFL